MNQTKRELLIEALIKRPKYHDLKLSELHLGALETSTKQDWLWYLMLSSMSTMGNSRGYEGLIQRQENYSLVSHDTLKALNFDDRRYNLNKGLEFAKVRRYTRKAVWLERNFEFIESCGGIHKVQAFILQTSGRECKIRLLKLFDGIGDKYARNIFLDMYHIDFVNNSIAIDGRILSISQKLEIDLFIPYLDHEQLFVEIAVEAGLSPWSLDRLLYTFTEHYITAVEKGV